MQIANPFFTAYRSMAHEEIQAARLLRKHGLIERATKCVHNARIFRKASFEVTKRKISAVKH